MQCPITPELWQHYRDTGDVQVKQHLATCARCRAEAAQFAVLQSSLASLAMPAAPAAVALRVREMAQATQGHALSCRETLTLLEAWREGELPAPQAFLLEDHLLWCAPCSTALVQAEAVTTLLRDLPRMTAPDAVAERIAHGRLPWWQRLPLAPPPSWSRQFSYVVATMAACLLFVLASTLLTPTMVENPSPSRHAEMAQGLPSPQPSLPMFSWPLLKVAPSAVPPVTRGSRMKVVPNHQVTDTTTSGVLSTPEVVKGPVVPRRDATFENPPVSMPPPAAPAEEPAPPEVPSVIASVEPEMVRAKLDNDLTDSDNTRDACINDASLDAAHPRETVVGL